MAATSQFQNAPAEIAAVLNESLGRYLAVPFDGLRMAYGNAVQLGLAPRSMLVSRDVERTLSVLERMTLGPWARRA
jgi:hypothetical protein